MNPIIYLQREMQALQRRTGQSAERQRQEAEVTGKRVAEESARNDEADSALVELAGMAADNAVMADEVATAQVELAGMVDTALTRQDETDAALVEIAGLVAEIISGEGGVE